MRQGLQSLRKTRRSCASAAVLAGMLLLNPHPALAVLITTGSYIQGFYNDGTSTYTAFTTFGPNIISYTNGNPSQATFSFGGTALANAYPTYVQASAAVSPTTSLTVSVTDPDNVTGGFASATAEIWDTLSFGNLPSGVVSGTDIGTLTFTISSSVTSTSTLFGGQAAYAFDIYNQNTFLPTLTGQDCGASTLGCSGLLYGVGNGGSVNLSGIVTGGVTPSSTSYTIDITAGELAASGGHISYIAEIGAYVPAQGPYDGNGTLTIDPSITLTNLYPGVTVSSASGISYTAPVPLPAAAWLLLSGLGGLGLIGRRRETRS